jgi:hypothetical protein
MIAAKRARPASKPGKSQGSRSREGMAPARSRTALLVLANTILAGCSSVAIPPTFTQDGLKAECDRHGGWWRPDDLLGGYCDFRKP